MTDVTVTFRADAALEAAFIAMAEEQGRSTADVLRCLMREAVAEHRAAASHDRWQRRQIVDALMEADGVREQVVPNDAIDQEWHRRTAGIDRDHD